MQISQNVFDEIFQSASKNISSIKPSEWAEQNRYMSSELTDRQGLWSYSNTPYTKEIVDCLDPSLAVDTIAIKKAAQIGFSAGVMENGIGWVISQNPGNILYLVGHEDLIKDSAKKIDSMIDGSGIRHLINNQTKRARKTKSGDTDTMKEYAGGYMKLGLTNHKSLANISMKIGFIDDFERMRGDSADAGATVELIEQRFAAFAKGKKLFFISSPEVKEGSNIEAVFLQGDQRYYFIPCPCCHQKITLHWETHLESDSTQHAGITWELDDEGDLIEDSVGYTCQKCGDFFDDRKKMQWLNEGEWIPTAKPIRPGYRSYQISALYAPVFMYNWTYYIRKFIEIHKDGVRNEKKYQAFVNLVLGLTYTNTKKTVAATSLMENNTRLYEYGTIPNKLSNADGNGDIVLLTCGVDLNGTKDDARIDYEIVGYSESGATYSIDHGSIGTFINKDPHPERREKMTYEHGAPNSVWPVLYEVLSSRFDSDDSQGSMGIFKTSVDCGHMTDYVYAFVDNCDLDVVSVKGDEKYTLPGKDLKTCKPSKSKSNLYLVESNVTKDQLDEHMRLTWNPEYRDHQPYGFLNFPYSRDGKYMYKNFFKHFEAEHKIVDDKGRFVWKKKQSHLQNHLYDCRLYANVARDIFFEDIMKAAERKNPVWADFVFLFKSAQ